MHQSQQDVTCHTLDFSFLYSSLIVCAISICYPKGTFHLTLIDVVYISGIVVDQNQALRFAIDIARGMEFLHSLDPGVPNLVLTSKHVMVC